MGLENRDYIRRPPPPSGFGFRPSGGLWAVKYLVIANLIVFVLQLLSGFPNKEGIVKWLDLRLAIAVGPEETPFFELERVDGRLPQRLQVPSEDAVPDERLEGGTTVTQLDHGYGRYRVVLWQGQYGLVPADALQPAPLKSWQLIWRLLTHGFCHGSLMHIAFNMIALYMFGQMIEPIYGSKEFLLFYLTGVVIAGLGHVALQVGMGQNNPAVGASGGVMAVIMVTAMIYPRQKVLLMMVIPIELRFLAVGVIALDLLGLIGGSGWNIAHAAHLGGAFFGLAYKYYDWRISGSWSDLLSRWRLRRMRRQPTVKLYQPDDTSGSSKQPDDMSQKVDALLEKISREGESSLSDSEREFLAEASRRYRDR